MAWSCKNLKSDALERFKKKAVFLWVRFLVKIQFPNPKTDHESIKSTLKVDSTDQIPIRIFEIHNLSVLLDCF